MPGYYSKMVSEPRGHRGEQAAELGIQRCILESLGPYGGYDVVIAGHCLHETAAPPSITVNGIPLTRLRFQPDGREIRGVLPPSAHSIPISVVYGQTHAEFDQTASM